MSIIGGRKNGVEVNNSASSDSKHKKTAEYSKVVSRDEFVSGGEKRCQSVKCKKSIEKGCEGRASEMFKSVFDN